MKMLLILVIFSFAAHGEVDASFFIKDASQVNYVTGEYHELELSDDMSIDNIVNSFQTDKGSWKKSLETKRKFSSNSIWYRFKIQNNLTENFSGVLEYPYPNAQKIEFYVLYPNQSIVQVKTGNFIKRSERNHQLRRASVDLKLKPFETIEVYVKINSFHIISSDFLIANLKV
jgi:hypothetical protein